MKRKISIVWTLCVIATSFCLCAVFNATALGIELQDTEKHISHGVYKEPLSVNEDGVFSQELLPLTAQIEQEQSPDQQTEKQDIPADQKLAPFLPEEMMSISRELKYIPIDDTCPTEKSVKEKGYVAGECLVRFEDDSTIITQLNRPFKTDGTHTYLTTGIASLDKQHKDLGITSIQSLAPASSQTVNQSIPLPNILPIYKITFDSEADAKTVCEEYAKDPNVRYAVPNVILYADHPDRFNEDLPSMLEKYAEPNGMLSEALISDDDTSPLLTSVSNPYYPPVYPNDYSAGNQWGLNRIDAPYAWVYTTGSRAVEVAVLGPGIDYNHPDLNGNVINWGEDQDGDCHLDVREDANYNGMLDPGEDIDGDGHLDVAEDTGILYMGCPKTLGDVPTWEGGLPIDASGNPIDFTQPMEVWIRQLQPNGKLDSEVCLDDGNGGLEFRIEVDSIDEDCNGHVDDIRGWNLVGGEGYFGHQPYDNHGLGTQLAGIIGAETDNSQYIAGMSPNVSIHAVKILPANLAFDTAKAVQGVYYAMQNQADILLWSVAYNYCSARPVSECGHTVEWYDNEQLQPLIDAIASYMTANPLMNYEGGLFIAPAGNSLRYVPGEIFPARWVTLRHNWSSIGALAVTPWDNQRSPPLIKTEGVDYSSPYGLIGGATIDVIAPNGDPVTTRTISGSDTGFSVRDHPSSYAAAYTAGLAALIRSTAAYSPNDIEMIIEDSAETVTNPPNRDIECDPDEPPEWCDHEDYVGHGLIDAYAAVRRATSHVRVRVYAANEYDGPDPYQQCPYSGNLYMNGVRLNFYTGNGTLLESRVTDGCGSFGYWIDEENHERFVVDEEFHIDPLAQEPVFIVPDSDWYSIGERYYDDPTSNLFVTLNPGKNRLRYIDIPLMKHDSGLWVYDGETNEPIYDARVTIYDLSGEVLTSGTSNMSGGYDGHWNPSDNAFHFRAFGNSANHNVYCSKICPHDYYCPGVIGKVGTYRVTKTNKTTETGDLYCGVYSGVRLYPPNPKPPADGIYIPKISVEEVGFGGNGKDMPGL